jgi:hypothetical protein
MKSFEQWKREEVQLAFGIKLVKVLSVVGQMWRFVVLEGKEYAVSNTFCCY